jgi:hypothetical protein
LFPRDFNPAAAVAWEGVTTGIIWLVVIGVLAGAVWWLLGPPNPNAPRSSGPGAGAVGTVYELLNEDKRKAIEIIVEQRAEARDAEDADGNLPDLEAPERHK